MIRLTTGGCWCHPQSVVLAENQYSNGRARSSAGSHRVACFFLTYLSRYIYDSIGRRIGDLSHGATPLPVTAAMCASEPTWHYATARCYFSPNFDHTGNVQE